MIRHCRRHRLLPAVMIASLAACAPAEDGAATVRDSAGIRIVESDRAAWSETARWRVGEPSVDIGGDTAAEYLLLGVTGARRLPDGRIVVPNRGTGDVRIYDREGRHLSTIGRRGQGPGEFAAPWRVIERPGDSLVVLDNDARLRISVFDSSGTFVRSFVTPPSLGTDGTELLGWFADGSSLIRRRELDPVGPSVAAGTRRHASLFRMGPDGVVLDSLGRFPDRTESGAGQYMWGPLAHAAVHDSTVFFGAADSWEIERRSWDGALRGIIRLARPTVAATPAQMDASRDALRRRASAERNPNLRAALERRVLDLQFAPTFPAYFALQTDAAGNLWVQEYTPRIGEGRLWSVFDSAGAYLGDVEMPQGLSVLQIGEDFVLGLWLDADDVEHVRVHPIIKPD